MAYNDYYNTNPSGAGGGYISMLEGYAKNYMDPNSQYNKGQYNQFKQMGTDNAAMQGQQGMRMQAAGQNPFANEQYRASMSDATGQAHNAYMQQNQQSQQLGTGMLGMSMQARMQMAQQAQQQEQWDAEQKQQKKGQWMGLGGTLLSAALMGPMGGMAGKGIGSAFKYVFGKKPTHGPTLGPETALQAYGNSMSDPYSTQGWSPFIGPQQNIGSDQYDTSGWNPYAGFGPSQYAPRQSFDWRQ